jgi:hypothetical protein
MCLGKKSPSRMGGSLRLFFGKNFTLNNFIGRLSVNHCLPGKSDLALGTPQLTLGKVLHDSICVALY